MDSFSEVAREVLKLRILQRDESGQPCETVNEMWHRVARNVASVEASPQLREKYESEFFQVLSQLKFLPNSPTLANGGTPLQQLSACFVLPIEDHLDGIFDSLKLMAKIQQSGGGTGFSFSRLRPKGTGVATTGGFASGPVSFMQIYDTATDNIRQGGRRRGANMGILRVDHPDILDFVDAKSDGKSFRNFNLSVGVTDAFMKAVENDDPFTLQFNGSERATLPATQLIERICQAAWKSGDPGMVFLDQINRTHPFNDQIEATNPCGEVPLLAFEACNLGSINLSRMVQNQAPHWEALKQITHLAVRFLDNVITVGRWPDESIQKMVLGNRKIGLGVMGFAEMLIQLGIPYASPKARETAESIMGFIYDEAIAASAALAVERGPFPNYHKASHPRAKTPLRNATVTSIAPTGTLSIIAGTSSGIEPLFALAFHRKHDLTDRTYDEINPLLLDWAQNHKFDVASLTNHLKQKGNLETLTDFPESTKALFATALEISPENHLEMQAAFQRNVDNAVSKTVNLPTSATPKDIQKIYQKAWKLGVKGITVYRYGSKDQQVFNLGQGEQEEEVSRLGHCDPFTCST